MAKTNSNMKGKKRVTSKGKKGRKTKRMKGGVTLPENTRLINPQWRHQGEFWSTVMKIEGTEIYGSSIPLTDELICFQTLAFYMFRLEIRRIISLQACSTVDWHHQPPPNGRCRLDYLDIEDRTWDALKMLHTTTRLDPNYRFRNLPMRDMNAGIINSWLSLNRMSYNDVNDRTLIHCAGGYGRTGAALLMLSWKRKYQNPNPRPPNWGTYMNPISLRQGWIGFPDGQTLFTMLRNHFMQRIVVSQDPINAPFQDRINLMGRPYQNPPPGPGAPNLASIANEVFHIQTDYLANLFIQRVNRMIMCWSLDHAAALGAPPQIALFPCYTVGTVRGDGNYTPANIFLPALLNNMIATQADALAAQQFFGDPNMNNYPNI
jgi:hypothetical protein